MSQDLLEQKELWNVGAGATTTTIPMVTQSGLSVALSTASQNQLVGSTFDCTIGNTRCMAVVNSVSASGVLTLDSPLPSAPAQGTQFVLTPTREMSLTGSNATLASANYDQALNVGAGTATTITITPPAGQIWKIKGLYLSLNAPTGATAGDHYVIIHNGDVNRNQKLYADFPYNAAVSFKDNYAQSPTSMHPTNETDFMTAIQNMVVTNANPLNIYYVNNTTGGTQTGTAQITVERVVNPIL